ncbi:alpha/beta hydrolase [Sediminibacterium roseum]|uniref:Alpha/beta hydrolase n=1 Tax=Sediminibacterium roseum TaxID=1978412 RepID=A0ABW9ZVW4_9BACT|nr:alpha/beta hydrolase [Sediminibacterium roseum]NCI49011.1 alpha/beta hydrolase [Sediminibacterium roseum]
MKKILSTLFFLASLVSLQAQQDKLRSLDVNLDNYTYPYPVQYITLEIQKQSLVMAFMDVKPAAPNGKTVLLLHGKNFNGAYWEQTAKALAANGYRVVIPDQVRFGKSSKPAHLQYSFQLLAQNTKAVLDSLKIQSVTVLGHSMGGMLATRFALMFPERTAKLILANPIGLEDWKTKVPYASVDKQFAKELKQDYDSLKQYQLKNYYHNTWKPAYDEWLNLLAGWTLSKDYPLIAWNSALTSDMIFTQPVCYEFENLKVPTLLIIGQADRTAIGKDAAPAGVKETLGNYPVLGRLTQQKIKNSKLVELDGVGHLPHVEAFDRFIKAVMDFL